MDIGKRKRNWAAFATRDSNPLKRRICSPVLGAAMRQILQQLLQNLTHSRAAGF
jgi:hypothetical protein